jgi:hypothetical protein
MNMMILRRLVSMVALLALVACGGGGGDSGTAPFAGGGGSGGGVTGKTPTAADLVLLLSASNLASNGTETVVATATAIDANRNTVAGVPVVVSVDANGVVTPESATTNASGRLNATVGVGSDRTNRTMTVTATSGAITKTARLVVQDVAVSGGNAPSDLILNLSAASIASNGLQGVTANVTALDAKRNVLPGALVSVSVDQGATVAPAGTTTGNNGVLSALVGLGRALTNQTINVTATAGGITRSAALRVVDVPSVTNPIASDLSLTLSSNQLSNSGSATITATIIAVDVNRNALSGIPVTVSVGSNAVATVSSTQTNAQGVVTAQIGIGSDRTNRSITVNATSGAVTKSATFIVRGARLTASFSPLITAGSGSQSINYLLQDDNSSPMPSQTISVSGNGLPSVTGLTDANGKFAYSYPAPTAASTLNVLGSAAGSDTTSQVAVQAAGSVLPNATSVPTSASLTPTPSVVSINSVGSTSNQVELRALFLGDNNAPIQNVRVRFTLDPKNASDGVVSQVANPFVYSDSTGVARATFTPGARSSPTNGVTVLGCWDTANYDINVPCPANRQISSTLTIASEALSVNIRTNNLVKIGTAGLTYIKEYVAMVVDAAGQAKPDVLITPSVDLTGYHKGYYFWNGTVWQQRPMLADTENYTWNPAAQSWQLGAPTAQPSCPNEDVNRNGVREAGAYSAGAASPALALRQEDLNWNGDLDPRKSDVAIKMVGSPRTDANGLAILQIEYGQNVASWVDFAITVTASGVAGTEARARFVGSLYGTGNLPYPATAVTTRDIAPAFVTSPYGKGYTGLAPPNIPAGTCTDTN